MKPSLAIFVLAFTSLLSDAESPAPATGAPAVKKLNPLPEKVSEADARLLLQLQAGLARAVAAREKGRADSLQADKEAQQIEAKLKAESARMQTEAKCPNCEIDENLKWVRPALPEKEKTKKE